jgi:hypothetical protein
MNTKTALASEAVKTSPSVVVAATTLCGLTLQEWVYVTAIIYALLQSAFLVWKWWRDWRKNVRYRRPLQPADDDG